MHQTTRLACAICVAAVVLLPERSASAQDGLEACGNIAVEYRAECNVEPPGVQCETLCTPIAVESSCASELRTVCANECTTTIVEEVVKVCSNSCVTECEVDPGSFDCGVSCQGRCSTDCSSRCAGNSSESHCVASCRANCAASCRGGCKLVLPSATCEQICTPSCRAEIQARETVDCQVTCQDELFTECEQRLVGGCKTDCKTTEGALFCEDQFVDHDDNLQECIEALENFEITVEGGASFTVSTSGCALANVQEAPIWPVALLLGVLPFFSRGRRRRRNG